MITVVAILCSLALTGPTYPADLNQDGGVGQDDFGHIQACLGYLGWIPESEPGCYTADLNGDGAVNQKDVDEFIREKELWEAKSRNGSGQ